MRRRSAGGRPALAVFPAQPSMVKVKMLESYSARLNARPRHSKPWTTYLTLSSSFKTPESSLGFAMFVVTEAYSVHSIPRTSGDGDNDRW